MLSRLYLGRPSFKPAWLPSHPRCSTDGRVLLVVGKNQERLIQLATCAFDQPCLETLERKRGGQGYILTLIVADKPLTVTNGGVVFHLKPRHYMIVNPKSQSSIKGGTGFHGLLLTVSQYVLRDLREAVGIPSTAGPFDFIRDPRPVTPPLAKMLDRFHEYLDRPPDEERDQWLPVLVYGAVVECLEIVWHTHPSELRQRFARMGYRPTGDLRLNRGLEFMRDHFAETCSNQKIAKMAGLSAPQFYRLFQKEMGCSPHEFLRRLRVDHAERLLKQAPKHKSMLAEVARAVGLGRAQSLKEAYLAVRGRPLEI